MQEDEDDAVVPTTGLPLLLAGWQHRLYSQLAYLAFTPFVQGVFLGAGSVLGRHGALWLRDRCGFAAR